MSWNIVLAYACALALTVLSLSSAMAGPIRTLALDQGEVGEVRTALGYSSVLEFQDPVVAVVAGDQDAFKVELVGQTVAVKPLQAGAATNLLVTTANRKFSFKIIVGPGKVADFVVRIGSHSVPDADWSESIGLTAHGGGARLDVQAASGRAGSPFLSIAFTLVREGRGILGFEPGDLSVRQGGKDLPIEHLYLERLELPSDGAAVHGVAVVRRSDLTPAKLAAIRFGQATARFHLGGRATGP